MINNSVVEDVWEEYFVSIIADAHNPEYARITEKISELLKSCDTVRELFDSDRACTISQEQCKFVLEYIRLDRIRTNIEMRTLYLAGHADAVNYLREIGLI